MPFGWLQGPLIHTGEAERLSGGKPNGIPR
jgi:hypothetical protein